MRQIKEQPLCFVQGKTEAQRDWGTRLSPAGHQQ